jgi:Bacterial Ig-like domain (group 1)
VARFTKGRLKWPLLVALGLGLLFAFTARPAAAAGVPYAPGDVFAADTNGLIHHYSPTGVLLDTLNTGSNAAEESGMCFGEMGRLRSTNFTANDMSLFDNMGNLLTHPWGSGFNSHPESCVLDAAGDIYVGQADGSRDVLKFDTSGAPLASYNVTTGPRGSDWIDLAADQCTLYYTSEGPTIRRFNVCTNTQLPDFATNFTVPGGTTDCYALRIRTNGEVMVACHDRVYRLDPAGTVIQTYPVSTFGENFVFALNLDPDGTSFWTAGIFSGKVYRINIATGALITQFATGAEVGGLAVFGEITAARPPASLDLEPKTATNPVGTQHCVTATVKDATGQPLEGVTVQFSVTGTAGNSASGSVDTDANGKATFCYTGPTTPGVDAIHAFADSNKNGMQDAGEPFGDATKEWVAGPPAKLTLSPKTAVNPVDSQHCVTATVTDAFGNPVKGVTVNFSVTGSVNTSGSATTDKNGQATFCYQGPPLPGADAIKAYADTNSNNMQDAGEPFDTATKQWVLPVSTPGCQVKITNGGWFIANNTDRVNFGGNAQVDAAGNVSGDEEYQDQGPAQAFNLHGNVLVVVCGTDGKSATIFGNATIDGNGSHTYRIDVVDNGEPGVNDHYRLRVDTYDSGDHTLMGGNIQVHKS